MRNQIVEIEIKDGRFVITAGIDFVCKAVINCTDLGNEFEVVDNDIFAAEILKELKEEEEDGTNKIHKAFDKSALQAVENGARGVDEKRNAL